MVAVAGVAIKKKEEVCIVKTVFSTIISSFRATHNLFITLETQLINFTAGEGH